MTDHKHQSVSQVTRQIKTLLETSPSLERVFIYGEISNFKHHSRGHMYFTLKDDRARISAVMFAGNNRALRFQPENGMKVFITGNISVYEPYGQYQLYVKQMEPDGIGQLYLAYEQLKGKLEREGYFDPMLKKPLPRFPKEVAVVTSKTGAVIRDIYTTIKRRYPIALITLYPVAVQGPNAVPSIIRALRQADQSQADVIIAGRGGGSIEELWAFNDEELVKTTHSLNTPIISAVGHETDVTLHDFVADVRAATPTAAAELAVPSLQEWNDKLLVNHRRLQKATNQQLVSKRDRLRRFQSSYAFKYPAQLLRQKEQELDRSLEQLNRATKRLVTERKQYEEQLLNRLKRVNPYELYQQKSEALQRLDDKLHRALKHQYSDKANRYDQLIAKLTILNPLGTLKRGYSATYSNEELVTKAADVSVGDSITVHVQDGQIEGVVKEIQNNPDGMLKGVEHRDESNNQ
ncbi:exodeoxyribonuclease VII large subunit [Geomicrobium sediminis]|uniref:Exodeoxyribonuclease 7 large subunit n=1 Tax=Geomicrobium sediminis TaxID=1347788 RepID=A0ABS2PEU2_9BACL|nr:exodeoxyribonuclease VII large subunit [Geomicrobium sediminis]MBM7633646.1 exodeoxyribonuclease VII large subunit [Geomicrobium sediminis]